jgi:hypothetical protein
MYNRRILVSLILVLLLWAVAGFYDLSSFAQDEGETITITAYYPSPHGVYNELQSNKLAVGDTNESGGLDAGDQPPADGQLYTARSIIYKPQSSLPVVDAREGELVYSDSDNSLYLYTGSSWVRQGGGGGGCYVSYSGSCLTDFTNMGSAGWWGHCVNYSYSFSHFRPPGGG